MSSSFIQRKLDSLTPCSITGLESVMADSAAFLFNKGLLHPYFNTILNLSDIYKLWRGRRCRVFCIVSFCCHERVLNFCFLLAWFFSREFLPPFSVCVLTSFSFLTLKSCWEYTLILFSSIQSRHRTVSHSKNSPPTNHSALFKTTRPLQTFPQ